jgi:hypothetical protein
MHALTYNCFLFYPSAGSTFRHRGQAAQTQKSFPSCGPLVALRRIILLSQVGQECPVTVSLSGSVGETVVVAAAGPGGVVAGAAMGCGGA